MMGVDDQGKRERSLQQPQVIKLTQGIRERRTCTMENEDSRGNSSDQLALALFCIGVVVAIGLFWIDKTPFTAGMSLAAIFALMVYPILHLVRSRTRREVAFVVSVLLVGAFGWRIWPRSKPQASTIQTTGGHPTVDVSLVRSTSPAQGKERPEGPKAERSHKPLASAPVVPEAQTCAVGSICNHDSPNSRTQTVNNGPPPAKLLQT